MKSRLRALLFLAGFLLLLGAAVGTGSRSLDRAIVAIDAAAFLAGSIIVLIKSRRSQSSMYYGQAAALPQSWRRWILDERDDSR